jgi:hypothetical protein
MKKLPNPYWKYNLDILKPFTAIIKTPRLKDLEEIVNLLHYGRSVQLKDVRPFRVKGEVRYAGMFRLTRLGRIKIAF